ncbi:MAG: valine--tRNA ligase [Myxococcota bacterium]
MNGLEKDYKPAEIERKWYKHWLEKNYFHAQDESEKAPFCIVIPPPNVTGELHMGHALTVTIEDILIRHKRMQGYNTLWVPGTDHAGIATQTVVERELAKEGKTRHDLGRKAFVERVWKWKEEKGGRISEQLKLMGSSLDWQRECFTLDETRSRAVREVFVRLYEEGLIYRANKLINWCPRCHTALSDLEVEHEENFPGEMWSFAYPIIGGGEIVVATTRPETMLGDTAIAVHPDDNRYKNLIGKSVHHPITGREFPIVGDAILVNPEFGTGAVKVTPAHDFNDFEVGKRHNLEFINILTGEGRINENGGEFSGMTVAEAREAVKKRLREMGLERGSEKHTMAIGHCQRCDAVVEPYLSLQWFVKIKPLAEPAIKAVEEGRITFTPKRWEKTYFNWMYNIQDWCISRQLWWGHRIPAWYCGDCDEVNVSREDIVACKKCGAKNIRQEEDVLDTWFSSALWPFSTLGFPEETKALKTFYPTSIMETGFDIIFFWVARMIMMGLYFIGDVPFRKVLLHPMVRDWKGEKMSKTRGNVIDPLALVNGADAKALPPKVAEKFKEGFPACGADALRFTLAMMAAQVQDVKLDPRRVEGYRFFANKLYNAARFSLRFFGENFKPGAPQTKAAHVYNRWILSELETLISTVNSGIENFRLDEAADGLYQFIWRNFCDWYIELVKPILYDESHPAREETRQTLHTVLATALKLLHPIMPFITEEIWHAIPLAEGEPESVIIAGFPVVGSFEKDDEAKKEIEMVIEAVTQPRNLRVMVGLSPSQKLPLVAYSVHDPQLAASFLEHKPAIAKLSGSLDISVAETQTPPKKSIYSVGKYLDCYISLEGVVDIEAEKERLKKELEKIEANLKSVEAKLATESFTSKAPPDVIEKAKENRADLASQRDRLLETLKQIG